MYFFPAVHTTGSTLSGHSSSSGSTSPVQSMGSPHSYSPPLQDQCSPSDISTLHQLLLSDLQLQMPMSNNQLGMESGTSLNLNTLLANMAVSTSGETPGVARSHGSPPPQPHPTSHVKRGENTQTYVILQRIQAFSCLLEMCGKSSQSDLQ